MRSESREMADKLTVKDIYLRKWRENRELDSADRFRTNTNNAEREVTRGRSKRAKQKKQAEQTKPEKRVKQAKQVT